MESNTILNTFLFILDVSMALALITFVYYTIKDRIEENHPYKEQINFLEIIFAFGGASLVIVLSILENIGFKMILTFILFVCWGIKKIQDYNNVKSQNNN